MTSKLLDGAVARRWQYTKRVWTRQWNVAQSVRVTWGPSNLSLWNYTTTNAFTPTLSAHSAQEPSVYRRKRWDIWLRIAL